MDDQQLRPILNFDKYLIDTNGVIYSRNTGKPRKTFVGNSGYEQVNLLRPETVKGSGKYITKMVHRLVTQTFLGDAEDLCVNHKDGNKLNNRLDNLEYVTRSANMRHALDNGLTKDVGENHHFAKLTEKQVHEICKLIVESELELKDIAKLYNISRQAITNITTKHRWTRVSDLYWIGKVQRPVARRRLQA